MIPLGFQMKLDFTCSQMNGTELHTIACNSIQLLCVVFQFFDKMQLIIAQFLSTTKYSI